MFVLSDQTTLNIRFPEATYANVEFVDHGPWPTEASTSADHNSPWVTSDTTAWASHPEHKPRKPVALTDPAAPPDAPPAGSTPAQHLHPTNNVMGTRQMEPTYRDPAMDPNRWSLSLHGGFGATNAYFYRGIGQENQDLILRSNLEGVMRVWRSFNPSDLFKHLDLYMGLTNSHHWGPTGRDGPGEKWYEVDIAGGARVGLGDRWEVDFGYVNRSAPSDVFTDVHQFELGLRYNDADPNYDFQLWPHLLISAEFDEGSDASNDFRRTTDEGIYIELGVRPEFELYSLGPDRPVTLAVPATIGLSVSDYYEDTSGDDETFGYFDIGLELSGPAFEARAEANRQYAFRWQAGVHFLILGDSTEDLSDFNGTGGDSLEIIGSIGFTVDH